MSLENIPVTSKLIYLWNVRLRNLPIYYHIYKKSSVSRKIQIIGMIRERNEQDLLKDSLDHLSKFVDGIIVFDDASTDASVDIAKTHPAVVEVIVNKKWKSNKRAWEETANRKKLYDRAKSYSPEWFFYCDADERFEGDIRTYLLKHCPRHIKGIRISLFDAYITKADQAPYRPGNQLINLRQFFGQERRDILMIWRNWVGADFLRPDAREPQNIARKDTETKFFCQHYGKSLSIEHWEDTCRYYAEHFPKYSAKWRARMGKAIHERSDFDTKLMTWTDVKKHGKIR